MKMEQANCDHNNSLVSVSFTPMSRGCGANPEKFPRGCRVVNSGWPADGGHLLQNVVGAAAHVEEAAEGTLKAIEGRSMEEIMDKNWNEETAVEPSVDVKRKKKVKAVKHRDHRTHGTEGGISRLPSNENRSQQEVSRRCSSYVKTGVWGYCRYGVCIR